MTVSATYASFDIDWVRDTLPAFDHTPTPLDHPALARYRRFYGIEYEREWPQMSIRIGALQTAGFRLAVQHYRHPTPRSTVFVLHGYYDHVGIFDKAIRALLGAGHDVVCFDLPGHGLSSGAIAAIDDFAQYQRVFEGVIALMQDYAPRPWHIVAQSTGGAIFIDHLTRTTHSPFDRVVLLAPLVRPRGYDSGWYLHEVVSRLTDYIPREFAVNSHDDDFLHFLKERDPLQSHRLSARWVGALKKWVPDIESRAPVNKPLMIIQGQQDGTVEYEHNLVVLRRLFPAHELVLLPRAGHQLVNESAELRTVIFSEMLRYLAASPQTHSVIHHKEENP